MESRELLEKLIQTEEKCKSIELRIIRLEKKIEESDNRDLAMLKLANSVELMAHNMTNMEKQMDHIDHKVDKVQSEVAEIKNQPLKSYRDIKSKIIVSVTSSIVIAILSIFGTLLITAQAGG